MRRAFGIVVGIFAAFVAIAAISLFVGFIWWKADREAAERSRLWAEVQARQRAAQRVLMVNALPGLERVAAILVAENGLAGDDALACTIEYIQRDYEGPARWWEAEPADILAHYRGVDYVDRPNLNGVFSGGIYCSTCKPMGEGAVPDCIEERQRRRDAEADLSAPAD
jgi:hypothetical protein